MTFREFIHFLSFHTTRYLSPMVIANEWVILAAAALMTAWTPLGSDGLLRSLRSRFRRIANRKVAAIVLCAVLPVAVRLAMLGFAPVPEPSIHDEFSHLLLGETLAHGRMTNPTHPMWMHFESIHIIQQPTYNSMYPPGQGVMLALGQVLFGEPWAGVVIAVGLMCAAICWMMQGWLPPAWAFYGTCLAILKIGIVGLYMNSYLPGAIAALGGALLLGAVPRLKRGQQRALHGLLAGLGMVILMNTRPFEGAVMSMLVLGYLMANLMRRWTSTGATWRKRFIRLTLLPAAAVLLGGFLFTGYYSWRVTGSPVRMPYMVNRDTYGWPENLAFLTPKKLQLRHQTMQDMYLKEIHNRDAYSKWDRVVESLNTRFFDNWTFFLGPTLTIPLLFLPWIFRDRRTKPLVWLMAGMAGLNVFQLVLYPYHLGPVVPALFTLIVQGMRHIYAGLAKTGRRRPAVYALIAAPFCLIVVGAMKQHAVDLSIPMHYWEYAKEPHRDVRAALEQWLKTRPRKQLVIVRYQSGHSPNQEWVYNHADIDGSQIVWAREMGTPENARLLQYFSDREAWLLEPDVLPQRVRRYRPKAVTAP